VTGRPSAAPAGADCRGLRFGIVASRYHEELVERLLVAAQQRLHSAGVPPEAVTVVRVPGSFELPYAAALLARARTPDAVICLGVLLRGETAHFDLIAAAVAQGLTRVALEEGIPVTFGVVTAETASQAEARAGGDHGNRGADAASAALEMALLRRALGPDR
jgi:6,7-dimethyl-8-ribityllumazine synthase